jgi:hypothetical protein
VASRIDNGTTTRTRPVFPYRAVARYDGSGSIDDAANFVSVTPRQPVRDDFHWLGSRLSSGDYQQWCTADGTRLVGKPSETRLTRRRDA